MSLNNKIIWSRRGILVAALLGLFASSYLLYTYTTGSDLKCGAMQHGCDAVRLSEWASWFGVPTPVFGVIFYIAVIIILLARAYAPDRKPKLARLGQIVFGAAGFGESVFLTYVQRFVIEQYCTWCLASAVAATAIFIFTLFDRNYSLSKEESSGELKFISTVLAIFIVAGGLLFSQLIKPVKQTAPKPEFIQGPIEALKPLARPETNQNPINQTTSTTSSTVFFHRETATGSKMQDLGTE